MSTLLCALLLTTGSALPPPLPEPLPDSAAPEPSLQSAPEPSPASAPEPAPQSVQWAFTAGFAALAPSLLSGRISQGATAGVQYHFAQLPLFLRANLGWGVATGSNAQWALEHQTGRVELGVGAAYRSDPGTLWLSLQGGPRWVMEVQRRHQQRRFTAAELPAEATVDHALTGALGLEAGVALSIAYGIGTFVACGPELLLLPSQGGEVITDFGWTASVGVHYAL